MGFNRVYRSLAELFPQVDARILKAVAIEHSKDVDAAAEVVLTEVFPLLSRRSVVNTSAPVNDPPPQSQLSVTIVDEEGEHESNQLRRRRAGLRTYAGSSSGTSSSAVEHGTDIGIASTSHVLPAVVNKVLDGAVNGGRCSSPDYAGREELISLGKAPEKDAEVRVSGEDSNLLLNGSGHGDGGKADILNMLAESQYGNLVQSVGSIDDTASSVDHIQALNEPYVSAQEKCSMNSVDQYNITGDSTGPQGVNLDMAYHGEGSEEELHSYAMVLGVENTVASNSLEHASDAQSCTHLGFVSSRSNSDCERPDGLGDDNDSTLDTMITRSGHVCSIELLNEIIEDAKNNKKTLFSVMESVMDMMKEVEMQEKAAEQAKEKAARGGLDIFNRVEELKQMLEHAKEANDMHAGEVYGEKAILATEAKELQNRLLSLSEERDRSLAILDEMNRSLKARLAAAEETKKGAEQEKLEKEELARKALAEQEAIMEKVVQESKILQQEAVENSKLQEFLMDRGRVVDVLQGEISVICQDVLLLKEKFDKRVPLNKSISSSQTSCILASSGSSVKSTPFELLLEPRDIPKVHKQGISAVAINDESSNNILGGDYKELLDEGWDVFDKDAEL